MVGSLRRHLPFWSNLNPGRWYIDVIDRGYALPFMEGVQLPRIFKPNSPSVKEHFKFVDDEIRALVQSKAVSVLDCAPRVVSPLQVATNATKLRLILDLSEFNNWLPPVSVKYEDWRCVLPCLPKGGYLASFDLKSGYHHCEILKEHRSFLGFQWFHEGKSSFFQYNVLPFGLSWAPWIFTKLLRPLLAKWRRQGICIALYLDDGLVWGSSYEVCASAVAIVRRDLAEAGWITAEEKCSWIPKQSITWLGLTVDLAKMSLGVSEKRRAKTAVALEALSSPLPSVRDRLRFAGHIVSSLLVLGDQGRLHTRAFYHTVTEWAPQYNRRVPLSELERSEVAWWQESYSKVSERSLLDHPGVDYIISSDASSVAIGAVSGTARAHRNLSEKERSLSSTHRELLAAFWAITSFRAFPPGSRLLLRVDSQSAAHIITKGSMKAALHAIAVLIWESVRVRSLELQIQWVPREKNQEADEVSKTVDRHDWGIREEWFLACCERWGRPSVDLFADASTAKCARFYSANWVPDSLGVDAFSVSWAQEFAWMVPPIPLVSQAIMHALHCEGRAILGVPRWHSQLFFSLLVDSRGAWNSFVRDVIEVPAGSTLFTPATYAQSSFSSPRSRSPFLFLLCDFAYKG